MVHSKGIIPRVNLEAKYNPEQLQENPAIVD